MVTSPCLILSRLRVELLDLAQSRLANDQIHPGSLAE